MYRKRNDYRWRKNALIMYRYKKLILLLLLTSSFSAGVCQAQTDNEIIVKACLKNSECLQKTKENTVACNAIFFLGIPYVSNTLEGNGKEQLVVNMKEMDCTTFVEYCLALDYTYRNYKNPDYQDFCNVLTFIRYRHGLIKGYESRLNYTSDWIWDNEKKGILNNITQRLGGDTLHIHLSYMSEHPYLYKSLNNDTSEIKNIKAVEDSINSRNPYYYIPKNRIKIIAPYIKDGDIICFTTSIKGLDVSHMGIAYWEDNILKFINASSVFGKVVISEKSLSDYCNGIRSDTGIILLRPS